MKRFLLMTMFVSSTYALDINHSIMLRSGIGAIGKTDTIHGIINVSQTLNVPIGLTYGLFLDNWLIQTGFGYKSGIRTDLKNPIIGEQNHLGFFDLSLGYTFNRDSKAKDIKLWHGLTTDFSLGFNENINDVNFGASYLIGKNRWFMKLGLGATKSILLEKWGGYSTLGIGFVI